jgi:hypothetical protein
MPLLSKRALPLLHQVNNRIHATEEHHEPDDKENVLAEGDYLADPRGSSDEEELRVQDSGISMGAGSQPDAPKSSADIDTTAFSEPPRNVKRNVSENIHVPPDHETDQWRKKRKKVTTYSGRRSMY